MSLPSNRRDTVRPTSEVEEVDAAEYLELAIQLVMSHGK